MSGISGITSGTSADSIRTDYLNLLITQLQNQNPLEPMDNNQMASQLAQLAQLEQVENINTKFDSVLELSQRVQAASLIGKEVYYWPQESEEPLWSQVSSVEIIDGKAMLQAGGHSIPLGAIQSIRNEGSSQEE